MPKKSGVSLPRTCRMRIVAQDPSVLDEAGNILTAEVEVPAEDLAPGPRGYRVHVIDYDASGGHLYPPADITAVDGALTDAVILGDPRFHARNVYAIVMRTLARFEHALGRRVSWGFGLENPGHQIKIAPHAFCEANAFYSRRDEALLLGYFPSKERSGEVFTCLSHDVVVHETTHALLDGLRRHFVDPSSPDQAAFHEGFSDVVALLSVFSLPEVVQLLMDVRQTRKRPRKDDALQRSETTFSALRASILTAVAKQLGREMSPLKRGLRDSVMLEPTKDVLTRQSAHERGEVLVAVMMDAFLRVWAARLEAYFADARTEHMQRERAAEEGARAAEALLTMAIRALDYCPPVHLEFGTFLSAMLTADRELRPTDRFDFRDRLREAFARYHIEPACPAGYWDEPPEAEQLSRDRVRFDAMQRDPDEVFRFAWENRRILRLHESAYTRVVSVRPCVRTAPEDGQVLRETVAEILQHVTISARDLKNYGIRAPDGMPGSTPVALLGGVTLVFDEFGAVKYAIGDSVLDVTRKHVQQRQEARLQSLWERGHFRKGSSRERRFSAIHQRRAAGLPYYPGEAW